MKFAESGNPAKNFVGGGFGRICENFLRTVV